MWGYAGLYGCERKGSLILCLALVFRCTRMVGFYVLVRQARAGTVSRTELEFLDAIIMTLLVCFLRMEVSNSCL
jgi:hypothetical protein